MHRLHSRMLSAELKKQEKMPSERVAKQRKSVSGQENVKMRLRKLQRGREKRRRGC